MFDLTCPHCGEPWDNDELHGSEDYTYRDAFELFVKYGCGAMDAVMGGDEPQTCNHNPIYPDSQLRVYRELIDEVGADSAEELASHWELVEMSESGELPF